ncbi:hypothetical protein BJY00DRAFT_277847 [Aspergillus carlsbadensis]|nr:hypothetical protein BJY00DRAFT_277847 [Aspergillus carlsbadensis]
MLSCSSQVLSLSVSFLPASLCRQPLNPATMTASPSWTTFIQSPSAAPALSPADEIHRNIPPTAETATPPPPNTPHHKPTATCSTASSPSPTKPPQRPIISSSESAARHSHPAVPAPYSTIPMTQRSPPDFAFWETRSRWRWS